jgi:hypothetical protein
VSPESGEPAANAWTDELKEFHVELFVSHPTMDPSDITAALGLEAAIERRAGDPRMTPKGTILPGKNPKTWWRHCREYQVEGQWFAGKVTEFVESLAPHKSFFTRLRAEGGRAEVVLQFLNGYTSDSIPPATLASMGELGVSFGIENFAAIPASGDDSD